MALAQLNDVTVRCVQFRGGIVISQMGCMAHMDYKLQAIVMDVRRSTFCLVFVLTPIVTEPARED